MQTLSSICAKRVLGNSDLRISALGFGAWALGGDGWQYSLGAQSDRDSIAAIHCALDLGINWIDTAPVYGLGHSEEVIARAVKTATSRPHIFTKCGISWRPDGSFNDSLRAEAVIAGVEASLRRLDVETIDLCQIHWPEPDHEIEEGLEALERLRDQGKIRWIGVSNFSVRQIKRAMKVARITSLQPHYSILRRSAELEKLPFAEANHLGVINYAPMGSGLLTGHFDADTVAALPQDDYRRKMPEFREPRLSRNLRLVGLLREIGRAHGVLPGVVAVAWTLHHPAITASIVGARSVREVEQVAPALHFRLSEDEYCQIRRYVGSIRWRFGSLYARVADVSWASAG